MTLIRLIDGAPAFADDVWTDIDDEDPLPDGAPAIVSLARWKAERESLAGRNAPIGVRLSGDESAEALIADLDKLGLIALDFPNLNYGRHFSTARLLRERHGFHREIRATGQVLRDQLYMLARCGFDAFRLSGHRDARSIKAAFGEISVAYQPATDNRLPAAAIRSGHSIQGVSP